MRPKGEIGTRGKEGNLPSTLRKSDLCTKGKGRQILEPRISPATAKQQTKTETIPQEFLGPKLANSSSKLAHQHQCKGTPRVGHINTTQENKAEETLNKRREKLVP